MIDNATRGVKAVSSVSLSLFLPRLSRLLLLADPSKRRELRLYLAKAKRLSDRGAASSARIHIEGLG